MKKEYDERLEAFHLEQQEVADKHTKDYRRIRAENKTLKENNKLIMQMCKVVMEKNNNENKEKEKDNETHIEEEIVDSIQHNEVGHRSESYVDYDNIEISSNDDDDDDIQGVTEWTKRQKQK